MDDASLDDFLDTGDDSSDEAETATESLDADEATEAGDSTDQGTDAAAEPMPEAEADATAATAAAGNEESQEEPHDVDDPAVDGVEPARSTMTFSPDPGECAACGESVSRRWTDGEELVCGECKEW